MACHAKVHPELYDSIWTLLWLYSGRMEVRLASPEANITTCAVHWGGEGTELNFHRVL